MTGMHEMMPDLLTSGTKTRNSEKLNEEIDFIGANIDASDDGLFGSNLKKHQEKLLTLMSDIIMNSDFKQAELDKIKKRTLSGLEAEQNEPDAMLQNVSAVVNYGKQHPYGEVATDKTVSNVTQAAVQKYYSTYFRPNVAYMAIVGDVTVAEIKPLIEKYFNTWQKANVPVTKYSNPTAPATAKVAFVPRDAAVQSVINVTYPIDLQHGTDDVIKAKVVNSILGGGANGRLFLNLRERHGWTYGSYSSVSQDELKGNFVAYAKCRNIVTDSSVGEIISEMRKLQTEKVGAEELQEHLSNMSGGFAISLESPQTVAQYAINIERYHMPKDYYQNYLKNLNAVTAEDVQMIARKYITPDNANIVVVGSKDDVAKTLAKYSKSEIAYYDNYGQPIVAKSAAAVPANVTATDVMKKYVTAIGGEKAIMGVKDIKTISKGKVSMGDREIELTLTEQKKAPAQMKSVVEGMGMVFQKKVFDGEKGYQEAGGQKAALAGPEISAAKQEADLYADLHPDQYKIKRTLKGMEAVNGSDAYILDVVDGEGAKSTEYYDVKSGLLIKETKSEDDGQGNMVSISTEYSNYKDVPGSGGYKIPFTLKQNGPMPITVNVETVEVNKNIPATEFN
ncbi:MAG: insulinase family protein [Sphingobacteriales bacterium]|nr:MAG: insulinase family protein [Sphingobacteriales bacterium]